MFWLGALAPLVSGARLELPRPAAGPRDGGERARRAAASWRSSPARWSRSTSRPRASPTARPAAASASRAVRSSSASQEARSRWAPASASAGPYDRSAILDDGLETRGAPVDPITPTDRFYVVTKNFVDPRVDRSLWQLEVSGSVDRERTYDYDELIALDQVEQDK